MGTTDGTDSPDLAISSADAPDFVLCGLPFWLLVILPVAIWTQLDPSSPKHGRQAAEVTCIWPATGRKALQR